MEYPYVICTSLSDNYQPGDDTNVTLTKFLRELEWELTTPVTSFTTPVTALTTGNLGCALDFQPTLNPGYFVSYTEYVAVEYAPIYI